MTVPPLRESLSKLWNAGPSEKEKLIHATNSAMARCAEKLVYPFDAAFLLSAQRLFIASERRFRPAGVIPPPCFLGAGLATADTFFTMTADFALRAAQYSLIAAACRF